MRYLLNYISHNVVDEALEHKLNVNDGINNEIGGGDVITTKSNV